MSKKYTITNSDQVYREQRENGAILKVDFTGDDNMQVSDGYHTMDELYEHRIALWIALCKTIEEKTLAAPNEPLYRVWRSKLHDDGSEYEGWFILGIGKEKGKIMTYHLPNIKWEETNFAETLDKAPEYDGHTSGDVLERLKNL